MEKPASSRGTETVVWIICSYQVSAIAVTGASTNENHKFYNSMVHAISIGGGGCSTKVVHLRDHFVDMGSSVKIQPEMG